MEYLYAGKATIAYIHTYICTYLMKFCCLLPTKLVKRKKEDKNKINV